MIPSLDKKPTKTIFDLTGSEDAFNRVVCGQGTHTLKPIALPFPSRNSQAKGTPEAEENKSRFYADFSDDCGIKVEAENGLSSLGTFKQALLDGSQGLAEGHSLVLLQMPRILPSVNSVLKQQNGEYVVEGEIIKNEYSGVHPQYVPEGHIGKLVIAKSGRVKLALHLSRLDEGNSVDASQEQGGCFRRRPTNGVEDKETEQQISFFLDDGIEAKFTQEAACLVGDSQELIFIGERLF